MFVYPHITGLTQFVQMTSEFILYTDMCASAYVHVSPKQIWVSKGLRGATKEMLSDLMHGKRAFAGLEVRNPGAAAAGGGGSISTTELVHRSALKAGTSLSREPNLAE